jgi:hypothetical protein
MKQGQKDENSFFNNTEPSKLFEQFLDTLGQRVLLDGFPDYTGGLDRKSKIEREREIEKRKEGKEITGTLNEIYLSLSLSLSLSLFS